MQDFSLESTSTLIFGRKGTGKTSFALRFLVNKAIEQPLNERPAGTIFIFDYKLEASMRLGIPAVGTEHGCEQALQNRIVIFNPRAMFLPLEGENFEGVDRRAFRWFCQWVFSVAQRGPGTKLFYVDELRRLIPSRSDLIPLEVDQIFREGRTVGIETLMSTQYPRDFSKTIREEVSEWVCFNINEPDNLDAVRPYFPGVDEVAMLGKGEFIAFNRDSRTKMRGKLF